MDLHDRYFLSTLRCNCYSVKSLNAYKMNRFKIELGKEKYFEDAQKNRESHLNGVPGFKKLNRLKGEPMTEFTLYSSHRTWNSEKDFTDWTKSEHLVLHIKMQGKTLELI